jgi:alkylated DNA repair dioxygenase AlkB
MDKFLIKKEKKNELKEMVINENIGKINGLTYIENFINNNEANNIIEFLDNQIWNNDLKRRTIHYGYKYDYFEKNKLDEALEIPFELISIKEKIENHLNKTFNQIIINEYNPGQGIYSHIDNIKLFDDIIVSLSLNSDIIMDFINTDENHIEHILLQKNSIVILENDARYVYKHGIKSRKSDNGIKRNRRISLTLRNVIL